MKYRIVRNPNYTHADFALARKYARIEDAVADMGEGLVIAEDGHVAAFHERHEQFMVRSAAFRAQAQEKA